MAAVKIGTTNFLRTIESLDMKLPWLKMRILCKRSSGEVESLSYQIECHFMKKATSMVVISALC